MAFFSIIIPTHNCEHTIIKCLASVANQNFQDLEVIIIDGCSSDNTVDLIKKFLDEHPGLSNIFINEEDQGVYDAMNKGAERATGGWLYFLGADDELMDNTILSQIHNHLLKKPKIDFFYGNAFLRSNGEYYDGRFKMRKLIKMNICHQAIFIKKNIFLELGPFDIRYPLYADWDLNLKVYMARKHVSYKNIVVVSYSNTGKSSREVDTVFEETLREIKKKFYSHYFNRLRSRVHYLRKRLKQWAM